MCWLNIQLCVRLQVTIQASDNQPSFDLCLTNHDSFTQINLGGMAKLESEAGEYYCREKKVATEAT